MSLLLVPIPSVPSGGKKNLTSGVIERLLEKKSSGFEKGGTYFKNYVGRGAIHGGGENGLRMSVFRDDNLLGNWGGRSGIRRVRYAA